MKLLFPAVLERDDNDTWLITCPALPEVTTFAEGEADWHDHARDAIEEAIAARMAGWRDVPLPAGSDLTSDATLQHRVVELSLQAALKLMLFRSCKHKGVSRAELARRLGWHREQVDRLFRLDHASRVDQLDAAVRALDMSFEVEVTDRADRAA